LRRAVFYLFFDPQGQVDDYVLHTLRHLRPHAEQLVVVSNSALDGRNRDRLRSMSDRVHERENVGLDVWAHKEAMEAFGHERLAAFDEILLVNSTFFGPLDTFDALFADLDARADVDFWGITEHGSTDRHAFDRSLPMEGHLQSHWIGVRQRMFTSPVWAAYWRDMPMIDSYRESIVRHESRFTAYFAGQGFRHAVAFPAEDYHSQHPIMDDVAQMIRDGCPIVKRRTFFHDPLYNESHATDGRLVARLMGERGYPLEAMYANLARTAKPRSLATNLALIEVLPEVDAGPEDISALRIVAVAHIYYPDMTDEILDRLDTLPPGHDLVITTADQERAAAIGEVLARRGRAADVRVVASNRGRDVSAFLVDCRDVIESDEHDLVVKVHSKRSPQDERPIAELFKRHLFENLLATPGHTANLLRLFVRHSSLGMVFPPAYHVGYPTLGHAWFGNAEAAEKLADRLGITVPFDDTTPLAAYGSMFVARPQTLRAMTSAGFTHDDFPDDDGYSDGALTHVLERLFSYVVLSSGHHVREVLTPALAATNYSFLEYRTVVLSARLPGYPREQLERIGKLKRFRRRFRHLEGYPAERLVADDDRVTGRRTRAGTMGRRLGGRPEAAPGGAGRPAGSGGTTWPEPQ
jgi:lipopolysaccharide biosynthesis protein